MKKFTLGLFGLMSVLTSVSAGAGAAFKPQVGQTVEGNPLGLENRWEICQLTQDLTAQGAYAVRCPSGEFIVGTKWVRAASGAAVAAAAPPTPPAASGSEAAFRPKVGQTVEGNPLGLENRWEICQLTQDLTAQGAYAVRCPSGEFIVGTKWVRAASAAAIAAANAPEPAVASAPPPPPPAAPAPPPVALPTAPSAEPVIPPVAVAPAPIGNAPPQTAIPDGLYLAPIGSAIEVLQILGGRVALNPRVYLRAGDFSADKAALVGTLEIAGSSLTTHWAGAPPRTGQFKFDGKCLSWGYLYCRAAPYKSGERPNGRYIGAATAGGGVVSNTSDLSFNADGTYTASARGAVGAPAGTTGAAASERQESGTYAIDGWTLRLTSPTAGVREFLSFPYEIYGPVDPIYFNGGLMRKAQ